MERIEVDDVDTAMLRLKFPPAPRSGSYPVICEEVAKRYGDHLIFDHVTLIGGSCAYATPIGMPANTMVLTAGGYTFKDYAKAGIPLIVVSTVVSMILLPIMYPFYP